MGNLLFSPSGRINSSEFMQGIIYLIIASTILQLLTGFVPALSVLGIVGLVFIWIWIVLYIKKFHDAGKSGWMLLLPLVASIVLLMVLNMIMTPMFAGDMQADVQKAMEEAAQSGDMSAIMKMGSSGAMAKMKAKMAIPTAIAGAVVAYGVAYVTNMLFPHDPNDNQWGPAN